MKFSRICELDIIAKDKAKAANTAKKAIDKYKEENLIEDILNIK